MLACGGEPSEPALQSGPALQLLALVMCQWNPARLNDLTLALYDAGSLYVPQSTASVASINLMQAGVVTDGSQDQVLCSLSSQTSTSASAVLLTAAAGTGSTSGGMLHYTPATKVS